MEAEHQARTPKRTTRREVDGIAARDEMLALPRWESFPREDRQRLVYTILQAARRQVKTSPASSQARR